MNNYSNFIIMAFSILLMFIVILAGCDDGNPGKGVVNPPDDPIERDSMIVVLDSLNARVQREYVHFDLAPVEWDPLMTSYYDSLSPIQSQTGFRELITRLLGRLQDENISLIDTDMNLVRVFTGNRNSNWQEQAWLSTIQQYDYSAHLGWGYAKIDSFAYFYHQRFNPETFNHPVYYEALDSLSDCSAMLLDLRMNNHPVHPLTYPAMLNSSDPMLSSPIIRRFISEDRLVARLSAREGSPYQDVVVDSLVLSPRGAFQVTRPVAILCGEGTDNAAELFISALADLDNITVIGDTTAGLVGATDGFDLTDGWSYTFPVIEFAGPDGTPRQGNPIIPDVEIPFSESSFVEEDDVLREALEWLGQQVE